MFKWIKNLVDAYVGIQEPKKPTIYKVGKKRYIRSRRISKSPVKRTIYEK